MAEGPEKEGPAKVRIANAAGEPGSTALGFDGTPGQGVDLDDGGRVLEHTQLWAQEDVPGIFPSAKTDTYFFRFPRLAIGDNVRMFDGAYRVERLSPLELLRLKEGEFPDTIRVNPFTYVFPIGAGGGLYENEIVVTDRSRTTDAGKVLLQVRIVGDRVVQEAAVGELLHVAGRSHRVRSIVLPDAKRRIVGYLEIDQVPSGVADR
jgi:hypothetical protein